MTDNVVQCIWKTVGWRRKMRLCGEIVRKQYLPSLWYPNLGSSGEIKWAAKLELTKHLHIISLMNLHNMMSLDIVLAIGLDSFKTKLK